MAVHSAPADPGVDVAAPTATAAGSVTQLPSSSAATGPAEATFGRRAGFWAAVVFVAGYCGVVLAAFGIQFLQSEFPCPLCLLQRMAMMLASIGPLWIVSRALRGPVDLGDTMRGYGLSVLGALLGMTMSVRQILLHIEPGDPGYGSAVFGLHLYTWALITFLVVLVYSGVMMLLGDSAVPVAPNAPAARALARAVMWLFVAIIVVNVFISFAMSGFNWNLPDDPTKYLLFGG